MNAQNPNYCQSRNPLKSGQCFLQASHSFSSRCQRQGKGRNPLKSGQCFLRKEIRVNRNVSVNINGRNPLKSGQCFLLGLFMKLRSFGKVKVAIPSNRVNVSYAELMASGHYEDVYVAIPSNRVNVSYSNKNRNNQVQRESQSPQIGSMFLT